MSGTDLGPLPLSASPVQRGRWFTSFSQPLDRRLNDFGGKGTSADRDLFIFDFFIDDDLIGPDLALETLNSRLHGSVISIDMTSIDRSIDP